MKTPYLVTVTEQTIKNGYEHDKQQAAKYLEVGKTYEIVEERIFDWHTNVWLREFPGLAFNSVHFETIEKAPAPTVATDNSGENQILSPEFLKRMHESAREYMVKQGTHDRPDITRHDFTSGYLKCYSDHDVERLRNANVILAEGFHKRKSEEDHHTRDSLMFEWGNDTDGADVLDWLLKNFTITKKKLVN